MEQKLREAAELFPQTNLSAEQIRESAERRKPQHSPRRKAVVAFCCTLLIALVSLGCYACAAEQQEYEAAMQFFAVYGLSAEDLTRGEIKSVYRDITTNSFTYEKTAEVLEKTLCVNMVPGFELIQGNTEPETMAQLWDDVFYNGNYYVSDPEKAGVSYRANMPEESEAAAAYNYLEKYDKGNLIWSVPIDEFWITGHTILSDGVIAYGQTSPSLQAQQNCGWITKIDTNGNRLWTQRLPILFEILSVDAVLENEDGSYAVISRGDLKYLCFYRYSKDGELLHSQKTEIGNYGIWGAARLGDGYLVQIGNYVEGAYAKLMKLDAMGNPVSGYSYTAEGLWYYITDMLEYEGKVYLSAYAVPEPEGDGSRAEIDGILNYLFDNQIFQIEEAELTPMVRENYTAVLLVCDPAEGAAEEFYQVKGSLGGKLSVTEDGNLCWAVENFVSTFFSPMTSSFTIGGTCQIHRYLFDREGTVLRCEKTGELSYYRR